MALLPQSSPLTLNTELQPAPSGPCASTAGDEQGTPKSVQHLRKLILEIQGRQDLTEAERALEVQRLMTRSLRPAPKNVETEVVDARFATFHSQEQGILGCEHYARGCKILAPCCDKFFGCRFCHDAEADHQIDRHQISQMMCMHCFDVQPVAESCRNPSCCAKMARYFCKTCNFFDDSPNKDIYHCPHCKLCRIGKGLDIDYFHCQRCNACMHMSLKDHKCVERSLESNCPICHDFMFTSTTPVMFLNCGHCMHVSCYEQYIKVNYTCPLCSKSLGDMRSYFSRLDSYMAEETMPAEFANLVSDILCCDCEQRSNVPFHFTYHKCTHCASYNTRVVATSRNEPLPQPQQ